MLLLRCRSVIIVSAALMLLLVQHRWCSAFSLGNSIPPLSSLSRLLATKQIENAVTESASTTIYNKRVQSFKTINSLWIVPILALTTNLLTPVPPANAAAPIVTATNTLYNAAQSGDESEIQGLKSITQSQLGKSIRRTVIDGARTADQFDLQWERFSDSLRDEKKCDPITNRRLFDNGYRRDGTRIGNPVLGALCNPEPLKTFDDATAKSVLDAARVAVVDVVANTGDGGRRQDSQATLLSMIQSRLEQVEQLVSPSFSRAIRRASDVSQSSPRNEEINNQEEMTKRQIYNKDIYTQMRAYGEVLSEIRPQGSTSSDVKLLREKTRSFDRAWGSNLLTALAPSANRNDFKSPFPKPDPTDEQPYNEGALLDALGAVSVALHNMQEGGLIGHWEISIPEDDDWNVVTIAVDDDISIGGQILARERNQALNGSAIVALVRSAMEDRAKISYKLDTFFIDPTTTRQELYNPTQLLVSLSDLGQ